MPAADRHGGGTLVPRFTGGPIEHHDRISIDSSVMLGKPTIKGTRVTVVVILRKLSEGATTGEITLSYPHLHYEDVLAALSFGADVVAHEEVVAG